MLQKFSQLKRGHSVAQRRRLNNICRHRLWVQDMSGYGDVPERFVRSASGQVAVHVELSPYLTFCNLHQQEGCMCLSGGHQNNDLSKVSYYHCPEFTGYETYAKWRRRHYIYRPEWLRDLSTALLIRSFKEENIKLEITEK